MEEEKGRPHFYNKLMILYIHNVTQEDFGTYKCLAKNSQGETSGEIDLNGTLEYTNVFKHMRTMFHAILFHHSFKSPLFYWFCNQTFLFINWSCTKCIIWYIIKFYFINCTSKSHECWTHFTKRSIAEISKPSTTTSSYVEPHYQWPMKG